MPTKRAKIMTDVELKSVLDVIGQVSLNPERDRLWVVLSFRAGMRAQEISHLHLRDILDATGELNRTSIFISGRGAKYGQSRTLVMHPDIVVALEEYLEKVGILRAFKEEKKAVLSSGGVRKIKGLLSKDRPLFHSMRGTAMDTKQGANSCQQHIRNLYYAASMIGCSSHSGRRTFITTLARNLHRAPGASLKDVQRAAGHSSLITTQIYIEGSTTETALIGVLGRVL